MFKRYDEAISWIHGRLKFGVKPGLQRMEELLKQLGSPEKKLRIIHVAGTNGKGSTISYMQHMLCEAGYKVGTFTSPYIETFNERISMNGLPISDDAMLQLVNEVKPYVEKMGRTELGDPTEFEIITIMMFLYFGKYDQPDYLLLETGLGGRLDSTNVVSPLLSVITNVGFDHMNILGNTLAEISAEKAGIIKANVPLITAVEDFEALKVIEKVAAQNNAPIWRLGQELKTFNISRDLHGESFTLQTPYSTFKKIHIQMKGKHQVKNAAIATAAIDYLVPAGLVSMDKEAILKGLKKTIWKGRFEQIKRNPNVIIDGAHNNQGIESLVQTIKGYYPNRKVHLLFSALKDKEYKSMIDRLSSIATSIHFTTFDFPRAETAQNLMDACEHKDKSFFESWEEALMKMMNSYTSEEDVIIITGSLYFISVVREYLLQYN
ncbi:bifunctional folylpolyglutamate synthase/dihydrofolate synthase [Bacillus weihaiensis]|uniref:bifunctional folylpolyglutamate synthase/dihydrofolate synthase n=1 Tax=Bacillus weihaiensis TaxID=1547283 RepID=UPI0023536979|nr:folylpolyglutamate synthase/dihydrofolate synthase family protein [Bacillus weihaiensis]